MFRAGLTWLLTATFVINPVMTNGADPFSFSRFFRQKRPAETAVVQLARTLDDLEKKLNRDGTVVAKAPDIWGEARLTKHRQEFEREMAKELDQFDFRLNASISRSDQAFLTSALAIGGGVGSTTTTQPGGATVATAPPALNFNSVQSLIPNLNATTDTSDPQNPLTTQNNSTLFVSSPGTLLGSSGLSTLKTKGISIEPEILLDQKARYLNHLHEIRRLNEGDDTSDSPGYSLNLVRVPVSLMPGTLTRKNHGAEVTITATPHVTDELLPSTFRDLVINDLVDLLSPVVRKLAEELPDLNVPLENQGQSFLELATFLTGTGDFPTGPLVLDYYGEKGTSNDPGKLEIRTSTLLSAASSRGPAAQAYVAELQQAMSGSQGTTTAAQVAVEQTISALGQAIYGMTGQLLHTGVGSVTRRSREPVSSSEIPFVFGVHELVSLSYDFRQRSAPGQLIHLADVRAYLHEELEAAYDLVSSSAPNNPAGQMLANPSFMLPSVGGNQWDGYTNSGPTSLPDLVRNVTFENTRELFYQRVSVTNQFSRILRVKALGQELDLHVPSVVTSLAWAVVVESALLNQKLNEDVKHVGQDPACGCMCPGEMVFCGPNPDPQARQVFADYVKCRWPIHVFALDPQAQDQNVADSFSLRREMQLALALAFAGGQINAQKMTRYVRRLEMDMETIALNRTYAAFGHGKDVFGWRFYPRVQSPPFESTTTTVFRDLLGGGPDKDDLRRSWEIEPGMRECTAIVLMPSFITHATFDIRGNYFPLGRHKFKEPSDTVTSIEDNMEMSHKIRLMENATCSIAAEANCYRDGEVQRLMRRADQIAKKLPLQTVHARVPNENTLGGFEMFSSGITDLAPELLDFYGMPGVDPKKDTVFFLVGNNFSVHDTKVLAGNKDVEYDLVSRQVMRVKIPAGVQTVEPFRCDARKQRCGQPSKVVDVHIATPYGVSQHLEIPVEDEACACVTSGYRWSTENLLMTYVVDQTPDATEADPTKKELLTANAKIRMPPPFELEVAVPPGNFAHPLTAGVELVITSPQLGLSVAVQPAATAAAAAKKHFEAVFDARKNVYRIKAAEFYEVQKQIQASFIGMVNDIQKGSAKTDGNFEINIQATIKPDPTQPEIPLDNRLTLNVTLDVL